MPDKCFSKKRWSLSISIVSVRIVFFFFFFFYENFFFPIPFYGTEHFTVLEAPRKMELAGLKNEVS